MNELDREGAQAFTQPSSEFYPEFSRAVVEVHEKLVPGIGFEPTTYALRMRRSTN